MSVMQSIKGPGSRSLLRALSIAVCGLIACAASACAMQAPLPQIEGNQHATIVPAPHNTTSASSTPVPQTSMTFPTVWSPASTPVVTPQYAGPVAVQTHVITSNSDETLTGVAQGVTEVVIQVMQMEQTIDDDADIQAIIGAYKPSWTASGNMVSCTSSLTKITWYKQAGDLVNTTATVRNGHTSFVDTNRGPTTPDLVRAVVAEAAASQCQ